MMPQIAGGPGITLIQELTNKVCLAATRGCCTFKDMGLAALDVLNGWEGVVSGTCTPQSQLQTRNFSIT